MAEAGWTTTTSSFRRLLRLTALSSRALDDAFSNGKPGVIPDKVTTGIGLAWTGTWISRPLAWFFWLFWRGKIFDRQSGHVVNRILPLDLPVVYSGIRQSLPVEPIHATAIYVSAPFQGGVLVEESQEHASLAVSWATASQSNALLEEHRRRGRLPPRSATLCLLALRSQQQTWPEAFKVLRQPIILQASTRRTWGSNGLPRW
jgi:hypothetical protein